MRRAYLEQVWTIYAANLPKAHPSLSLAYARTFLPFVLQKLTGVSRSQMIAGRDFQWSSHSWTHNVFRLYEKIFWRRDGIRAEISSVSYLDAEGIRREAHYAHSFEACFALVEHYVRIALRQLKFAPVRIWIPVMKTPQGVPFFASPYLFAIAFDAVSGNTAGGGATWSMSHTVTGTNVFLIAGALCRGSSVSMTWNTSETMTQQNSDQGAGGLYNSSMRYKVGPSTGTHNIDFVYSNLDSYSAGTSYSGVKQTSTIDSTASATGSGVQTLTATTTVVGSGCWLVCYMVNDQNTFVAGTGCTIRGTAGNQNMCDSNGTVGTGSQSMTATWTNNANYTWNIVSIAAAAASTSIKTWNGLAIASVKTINGLAIASVKTVNGLA